MHPQASRIKRARQLLGRIRNAEQESAALNAPCLAASPLEKGSSSLTI